MTRPEIPEGQELRYALIFKACEEVPDYCYRRIQELSSGLVADYRQSWDTLRNATPKRQEEIYADLFRQVAVLTIDRAHAVADAQLAAMARQAPQDGPAA